MIHTGRALRLHVRFGKLRVRANFKSATSASPEHGLVLSCSEQPLGSQDPMREVPAGTMVRVESNNLKTGPGASSHMETVTSCGRLQHTATVTAVNALAVSQATSA